MSNALKALRGQEETLRRSIILALLFLIAPVQAMLPIIDPDIWFHLRAGQWILEHGTVPATDPFSAYGSGKPWVAYSWLFEILVYGFHKLFGIVGIIVFTVILSGIIGVALYNLVGQFKLSFLPRVALTALGLAAMKPLFTPRSFLFTTLFFILELRILLALPRSEGSRRLLLLPLLFVLWANIHIQFVYGLFILLLACAAPLADRFFGLGGPSEGVEATGSPEWWRLVGISGLCFLATLINPYHLYVYGVVLKYLNSEAFLYIQGLQSLSFRTIWEWLILAVTLAAAFSLGWQRQNIHFFPILLLATGAYLSFRAVQDSWVVVVCSVAIIASTLSAKEATDHFRWTPLRGLLVAFVVVVLLIVFGRIRGMSGADLQTAVSERFPVAAAAHIEEHKYPGPLYNAFGWGNYLIWRLRNLPVSMDGRVELHGDLRILNSMSTWAGERGWESNPELTAASLVIASPDVALASLLKLDPRFELVYSDHVAVVFVSRSKEDQ